MADETLLQQDTLTLPSSLADLLLYGINNEGSPFDGQFPASLLTAFFSNAPFTRELVSLSGTNTSQPIASRLISKINTRPDVTIAGPHIYEVSYSVGYVYVREAYLHLAGPGVFGAGQDPLPLGQFGINILRVDQIQEDTEGDVNDLTVATSIEDSINNGGQTYVITIRRIFRRTISGEIRTYVYLGNQAQIGHGQTAVAAIDFEDITADGTVPVGSVPESDNISFDGFLRGFFFRQNDTTVDGALRGISLINEQFLKAFGINYVFDNVNPAYYTSLANLYLNQSNQLVDKLYFVDADDKIYRYLGTTNGDLTDYEAQVLFKEQTPWGKVNYNQIESNVGNQGISPGDYGYNSALAGNKYLFFGEYVSGDPIDESSWTNADIYDPNDTNL